MDDATKQINEYVEKFETYLGIADAVIEALPLFLNKIRATKITERAGELLDSTFDEVMHVLRPLLVTRWNNWQKDRIEWLADRVRDMTKDGDLDEETAIEILKIHQAAVAHSFQYAKSNFWENRAKSLQHKLEAAQSVRDVTKGLKNLFSVGRH